MIWCILIVAINMKKVIILMKKVILFLALFVAFGVFGQGDSWATLRGQSDVVLRRKAFKRLLYTPESFEEAIAFGLKDNQEHTMCGSIPYGRITTIEIIKPNGIDLFCPQLKIAFANRCLLFAIDASDNRVKVDNLRHLILAEE